MGSSDDSPQTCSPQHEVAAPLNRCGDGRVPEVFTASVLRDLDAELVCQGCQQQSGQLLCAQCGAKAYCGERESAHARTAATARLLEAKPEGRSSGRSFPSDTSEVVCRVSVLVVRRVAWL